MEALLNVSEKAANIARVCRQNEHLFALLVEEKSIEESNPRFIKDFKTLADVLIQETIRYEVGNLVSKISIVCIQICIYGACVWVHFSRPPSNRYNMCRRVECIVM